jgi:hypothetical protein
MYVSNRKIVAEKCNGNPNEREAFHLATDEVEFGRCILSLEFQMQIAVFFVICFHF